MSERKTEWLNDTDWINEWMDGWVSACMGGWVSGWMDGWARGKVSDGVGEWRKYFMNNKELIVNQQVTESKNKSVTDPINQRINRWSNQSGDGWINERTKKRSCEWMRGWMSYLATSLVGYFFTGPPLRGGAFLSATSSLTSLFSEPFFLTWFCSEMPRSVSCFFCSLCNQLVLFTASTMRFATSSCDPARHESGTILKNYLCCSYCILFSKLQLQSCCSRSASASWMLSCAQPRQLHLVVPAFHGTDTISHLKSLAHKSGPAMVTSTVGEIGLSLQSCAHFSNLIFRMCPNALFFNIDYQSSSCCSLARF